MHGVISLSDKTPYDEIYYSPLPSMSLTVLRPKVVILLFVVAHSKCVCVCVLRGVVHLVM